MEDKDTDSVSLRNVDVKLKQDEYVLSAEDLAWADSCLNADIELSETNMDLLKEALLDILDQHSELLAPSANEDDNSNDINDPRIISSVADEETSLNDHLEEEITDVLYSLKQQPFLPNYNDEMMKIQFSDDDDGDGFVLSETMIEPLCDDIFKVWDLDISDEEDELEQQLKEALCLNPGTKVVKKKGLEMESVDSLVESIADLCLK
ncbi:uncharacterized protein [Rutidosis leptorrhynchoides]|uniref:uncharacterized protein n=1 Tax=Rutidosis leptorrhynchoides TaxID=125765 RepID=UPI003A99D818